MKIKVESLPTPKGKKLRPGFLGTRTINVGAVVDRWYNGRLVFPQILGDDAELLYPQGTPCRYLLGAIPLSHTRIHILSS